jgi:hypothetical protein
VRGFRQFNPLSKLSYSGAKVVGNCRRRWLYTGAKGTKDNCFMTPLALTTGGWGGAEGREKLADQKNYFLIRNSECMTELSRRQDECVPGPPLAPLPGC